MRFTFLIICMITVIPNFSYADYGVPFIFQSCYKSLDFVTFKFEYVNHPEQLYDEDTKGLPKAVRKEFEAKGVIYPGVIDTSICELDNATIKVWLEKESLLSLSINGVTKVDSIPINGGSIFFDKLIIDGHSFPKGADKGGLSFCFYGPDKDRSVTKEYFYIYQQYPNSEVIDMNRLKKEVNDRNNWENPSYFKDCDGFQRYI
ncbi:hypothetical protein [Shewanella sp. KCT]|uniref:hypothetical protein n=1 Tax=Shewanella sp. KCT TaxID=2569535 RepID=UPI001183FE58|nr:hypothetical protein [Shewanella sp. KCT]TVP14333.1 hypothetical protein AYI87_10880 [Shewanella sp. KCT]